jgi:hypothetical protein
VDAITGKGYWSGEERGGGSRGLRTPGRVRTSQQRGKGKARINAAADWVVNAAADWVVTVVVLKLGMRTSRQQYEY